MFYSEELVEEVRSRNDIVDVIGSYVHLQKKGNHYFGLCPFHNEKTGSFSVTGGSRQMYYCYGCHEAGNVITFVMKYENFTFPEALKMLADKAGVQLPEMEYTEEMKKRDSVRTTLLEINKEAATYFYRMLRDESGKVGQAYFDKRQLTAETRKSFGLGYSGMSGDGLLKYLKSKGYSDEMIIRAGLATYSEKRGLSPFFWNRVMFPIQDMNHRVIGFGGRVMGDGEPKYLNSRETEVFDKRRNLFGMNFARTARKDYFILCEGYMDVISMHQAGFNMAVASLGTAFTSEQATLLRRYVKNVYLSYDSDGAGTNAALRAIEICRNADISTRIIRLEPYKDPDEFIKNLGREELQKRIENAESSFFFELRMLERQFDMKEPEGKTAFFREVAVKICSFADELERDNYIEAAAQHYGIGADKLKQLVAKQAARTGGIAVEPPPKTGRKPEATIEELNLRKQRMLLTIISELSPEQFSKVESYVKPEYFTDALHASIATQLFAQLREGRCNPAALINQYTDSEEQSRVGEIFNTHLTDFEEDADYEQLFTDLLFAVRQEYLFADPPILLTQYVEEKKATEALKRTKIKFL